MLGAPAHGGHNMRLYRDESLDDDILDPTQHRVVIDANLLKVVLELGQVPLTGVVFTTVVLSLASVGSRVLDILIILLVDGVVSQMDELLLGGFLGIGVFLGRESDQALLHQVDFERVKARYKSIDPQIVLEAMDQVGIADVLGDHIAWLPLDFLLLADDLDATSATGGAWLHDVHVLVVVIFSVHDELPVVVWEEVSLWAEVILLEDSSHSAEVLPHQILAADLETLWKVIDFLILRCLLEVFRFGLSCPHNVPFGAVGANYPEASILQTVDYRIVDVSGFCYLEPKCHVVMLEVVLLGDLHFLELTQIWSLVPFDDLEETCTLLHIF